MKPFDNHRRGFSLIELMTSQVIALIVITGLFSVVVASLQQLSTSERATEAQIRLRQALHINLRELQALGGDTARPGVLLDVVDGGATGADTFSVFKTNPGLCGGSLASVVAPSSNMKLARLGSGSSCPIESDNPTCAPTLFPQATVLVSGGGYAAQLLVDDVDSSSCALSFDISHPTNSAAVEKLANELGAPLCDLDAALAILSSSGKTAVGVQLGAKLTYRIHNEELQRKSDFEDWHTVVTGVFDMQIRRGYDINYDGVLQDHEWVGTSTNPTEASLVGASAVTYFGAEVALVTFAKSSNDVGKRPPSALFNRSYSTAPPDGRRYRYAKIFAATRN